MATLSGSATVWINAFIPRNVPDYTKELTLGPHRGKTAVPLPGVARLNPLNWTKDWSAGYLTDQRTYNPSTSILVSVRMQSLAVIDIGSPAVTTNSHRSSGTTQVNIDTGDQTGFAVADMGRCAFGPIEWATQAPAGTSSLFPTPQFPRSGNPQMFSVSLKAAAGDPLVSAAADIDYVGVFTFVVDMQNGSLSVEFDGKIDAFPAFEGYAMFNGVTKTLFTIDPPKGNTVADLLGPANRPVKARVVFQ